MRSRNVNGVKCANYLGEMLKLMSDGTFITVFENAKESEEARLRVHEFKMSVLPETSLDYVDTYNYANPSHRAYSLFAPQSLLGILFTKPTTSALFGPTGYEAAGPLRWVGTCIWIAKAFRARGLGRLLAGVAASHLGIAIRDFVQPEIPGSPWLERKLGLRRMVDWPAAPPGMPSTAGAPSM